LIEQASELNRKTYIAEINDYNETYGKAKQKLDELLKLSIEDRLELANRPEDNAFFNQIKQLVIG